MNPLYEVTARSTKVLLCSADSEDLRFWKEYFLRFWKREFLYYPEHELEMRITVVEKDLSVAEKKLQAMQHFKDAVEKTGVDLSKLPSVSDIRADHRPKTVNNFPPGRPGAPAPTTPPSPSIRHSSPGAATQGDYQQRLKHANSGSFHLIDVAVVLRCFRAAWSHAR